MLFITFYLLSYLILSKLYNIIITDKLDNFFENGRKENSDFNTNFKKKKGKKVDSSKSPKSQQDVELVYVLPSAQSEVVSPSQHLHVLVFIKTPDVFLLPRHRPLVLRPSDAHKDFHPSQ